METNFGIAIKYLFGLAYIISVASSIIVVLLDKRNPQKAISWIIVLLLVPYIGIIFYLIFGEERRRKKIISRKSITRQKEINGYYDTIQNTKKIESLKKSEYEYLEPFKNLLYRNSNGQLYSNNEIEIFHQVPKCYDSIIENLKTAKHHIHLEYYIFKTDRIGNTILNILEQKVQQGVEVRIILDSVGSWKFSKKEIKRLRKSGIDIRLFLKVRFPFLSKKINHRNHRKILIIDGKLGYIGGVNIADNYIEPINNGIWRDSHMLIKGDAVKALQSIFMIDWYFVSRKEIIGEHYYPINTIEANCPIQIAASSPDWQWENITQAFIKLILSAKDYVYIHTPYFIPTESIIEALKIASLSGVDVRIIIPKTSDIKITKYSSMAYIEELLEAQIGIYLYKDGFIHSKAIVADDMISTIGSANFDFRSLEHNFEINAFIYHKESAIELREEFKKDFNQSMQLTLQNWKNRKQIQKIVEGLARLLSPIL